VLRLAIRLLGPLALLEGEPGGCDFGEGRIGVASLRVPGGRPLSTGVLAVPQQRAGSLSPLASFRKRYLGIDAEGDALLAPAVAILEAPIPGAGCGDFEVQPSTVEVLAALGRLDRDCRQLPRFRHGSCPHT